MAVTKNKYFLFALTSLVLISLLLLWMQKENRKNEGIGIELLNTYTNKKLEFSIKYPLDWHITDFKKWTGEENTISGATDLTIANFIKEVDNFEGPWWAGLPEDYKAINVRIYDRGWPLYKDEYLKREEQERGNAEETVKISVSGSQSISVYIDVVRNSEPDYTWDGVYPSATAFYKGYNYAYTFDLTGFRYSENKEKQIRNNLTELVKEILRTFKDLNSKSIEV